MEDWVPIQGFPGYSVSTLGRVRRDSSGRILRIKVNQYGVPYIGLMRDWDQKQRSLALLVARAFIPNTSDIFDTPINLDGDRFNCAVDNLMWRPRWFAVKYNQQFTHGRYSEAIEAPVRAIETGEVFRDSFEASCRYGVLERDLVLSIVHHTVTWPNYMRFELA
jgi:hypothetical protein